MGLCCNVLVIHVDVILNSDWGGAKSSGSRDAMLVFNVLHVLVTGNDLVYTQLIATCRTGCLDELI